MAAPEATTSSSTGDHVSELEAWREVHGTLIEAVKASKQAVDALKAQKRFWLEEISANLNEDGKLTATSVWKRPSPAKKAPARKAASKPVSAAKRKKKDASSDSKPAKKPRKKKQQEGDSSSPPGSTASAPKKTKIKIRMAQAKEPPEQNREEVEHEQLHSVADTTVPPEYYLPNAAAPHEQQHSVADPTVAEYYAPNAAAHPYQPADYPQPTSQWAAAQGAQNLQMMAAVAFGASAGGYPSMIQQQQQYNPYYAQQQHQQHHQHQHPHPTYHHQGSRTYSSIMDVGNSDDESDNDKF